jgi:hypothetical protein
MHTNGDTSVDRSATGRSTRRGLGQRYSIPEAAKVLGLTEEAVRQRVKRGTLDSIKVGESLFVLLDTDTLDDTSSDRLIDQERHVGEGSSDTSRLVESLEDEVAHLRRQLDQVNERDRENRRISAGLVQRVPELEAPREPREVPESASEDIGRFEVPPEPQEPVERRSWLHRFFGFE